MPDHGRNDAEKTVCARRDAGADGLCELSHHPGLQRGLHRAFRLHTRRHRWAQLRPALSQARRFRAHRRNLESQPQIRTGLRGTSASCAMSVERASGAGERTNAHAERSTGGDGLLLPAARQSCAQSRTRQFVGPAVLRSSPASRRAKPAWTSPLKLDCRDAPWNRTAQVDEGCRGSQHGSVDRLVQCEQGLKHANNNRRRFIGSNSERHPGAVSPFGSSGARSTPGRHETASKKGHGRFSRAFLDACRRHVCLHVQLRLFGSVAANGRNACGRHWKKYWLE